MKLIVMIVGSWLLACLVWYALEEKISTDEMMLMLGISMAYHSLISLFIKYRERKRR